jgi:alkanesulfonate monooxygenase SsuD/methylene tetrahydromethanopterin reductase-like flavin-dependent oxidoreductase (luciferase family)
MRYGIEVVPFGEYADPRRVLELARTADAAGWEALCIWDHLLFPWGAGDPWVALAAAAAETKSLRLVTGVAALPRYQPGPLARLLVGLDILSQGRVILGAGAGAIAEEFTRFGGPAEPRQRAQMLDEQLEILARLWSGEAVSFAGKHYQVDGAALVPVPVQQPHIPVWIGGESRAALHRAACWDGWIIGLVDETCQFTRSPEKLAGEVEAIHQARLQVSRSGGAEAGAGPTSASFDVAVSGISLPGDSSRVQDYAAAGATWWLESLFGLRGSHGDLLERVKAGPPG